MLLVTEKETAIHGTKMDIATEFCCLVNHLVCGKKIFTKEDIEFFISMATLPKEELKRVTVSSLEESILFSDE